MARIEGDQFPLTCPLPHFVVERDLRNHTRFYYSLSPFQGERLGEGVI